MATAQQSAQEFVSLWVTSGARPGHSVTVVVTGPAANIGEFSGPLQAAFLQAGYAVSDLIAGLGYAVEQGWLSLGNKYGAAQLYVLEQAGFAEANGSAPTMAAAAQQLVNVCAALNGTAGAAQFEAAAIVEAFVGTVGGNTFAVEDLIPALGYALSQGWVRLAGAKAFDPVFTLTAAGIAQAT